MAPPRIPIDPSLVPWPSTDSPRTSLNNRSLPTGQLDPSLSKRRETSNTSDDAPPHSSDLSALLQSPSGGEIESHPLLRFWREKGDPWTSQRIGGVEPESPPSTMDRDLRRRSDRSRQPFNRYNPYQSPLQQEAEGSDPSSFHGDSGYASRQAATASIYSAGYASQGIERQSVPEDLGSMAYMPDEQALYAASQMSQESPYAPVRPPTTEFIMPPPTNPLICEQCPTVSKNLSEAK